MKTIAAGLVLLLGAATAQAQGQNAPRRPREEAFKMVEAYVVSNLQESLGLTDDQFAKLLPHVKRLQKDRRELAQRRGQAMGEMRRALGSGTATEARIGELLKQVKAVEAEQPEIVRKDMESIDAVLSPVQQAKFRLLEGEVERKIRALMTDMRPQNRNGMRKRQNTDDDPEN